MMDGWTRIKLYDKGWFQFPNCKFPFLSNNRRICPIVVATNLYSFLECEIIKLDLLPIYIIRLLSRRMPHFWHNLLTSPDHLVSVRVLMGSVLRNIFVYVDCVLLYWCLSLLSFLQCHCQFVIQLRVWLFLWYFLPLFFTLQNKNNVCFLALKTGYVLKIFIPGINDNYIKTCI